MIYVQTSSDMEDGVFVEGVEMGVLVVYGDSEL